MPSDLFAWVYFWRVMLDAKGKLQQGLWLMDKMQYALWCYEKNADAVNWYQRDKIAPALKKKKSQTERFCQVFEIPAWYHFREYF